MIELTDTELTFRCEWFGRFLSEPLPKCAECPLAQACYDAYESRLGENGMYDLSYEELRVEHSEAIDKASQWGFHVYQKILPILGSKRAGETANKVYAKILEQEGVPCLRNK